MTPLLMSPQLGFNAGLIENHVILQPFPGKKWQNDLVLIYLFNQTPKLSIQKILSRISLHGLYSFFIEHHGSQLQIGILPM